MAKKKTMSEAAKPMQVRLCAADRELMQDIQARLTQLMDVLKPQHAFEYQAQVNADEPPHHADDEAPEGV